MNIGVFFRHKPSGGGIYQYFLTVMESVLTFVGNGNFFLYHCHEFDALESYRENRITTINLSSMSGSLSEKRSHFHDVFNNGRKIQFKSAPYSEVLKKAVESHNIKLMLYTNIERESFEIDIPYVTAFHDWTHLTHPEFPEFVSNGVYDQREYVNWNGTKKALAILVDSEVAKNEVIKFYRVPSEKIYVLPFIPPPAARRYVTEDEKKNIKNKYNLPDRFLFYPAQFWPHKNHENVFRALSILKVKYSIQIHIVLVGSTDNPWSNIEQLKTLAEELGITTQIIYPGYVDDADMAPLYSLAFCLVMPTFPGPTNIPVLEAISCGCPVITTDQPALREQLGNAAEFVNPYHPEDIAASILKLLNGDSIREDLINKGYQRIRCRTLKHFSVKLESILLNSLSGNA